jgi:ankyrin repeat protein
VILVAAAALVLAAAPARVDVDGTTPLHRAAYEDNLEAAGTLVREGADAKAVNRYGITPLYFACMNGNAAMVELLLKAGADPNGTTPGGETALMTCSRTGKVDAVKAHLSRGADVKAKESRAGQTAIMWAAAEGHAETVQALIDAGADLHASLNSGFTPLLFGAREGHIDVVRTLLKAGADINQAVEARKPSGPRPASGAGAPRNGTTALHLAVGNAHYDLAAFLLENGANPNAIGVGYAPLHMITWVRKPGGGDNDPAPRGSGMMTSVDMVKKLVAHGADLNVRMTKKMAVGLTGLNTVGATPFLLAARTGDAELMRLLAELGADPKLPNADGATPLIVAAGLGTRSPGEDAGTESEVLEAVQAALDLGNDINAVDNNGETAMHGAAYKNLPAVVELLAAKGARIDVWNRKNKYGWTPLTIAQGHRFGNYKPSQVTIDAFVRVMKAAGVTTFDAPPSNTGKNSNYVK